MNNSNNKKRMEVITANDWSITIEITYYQWLKLMTVKICVGFICDWSCNGASAVLYEVNRCVVFVARAASKQSQLLKHSLVHIISYLSWYIYINSLLNYINILLLLRYYIYADVWLFFLHESKWSVVSSSVFCIVM